MKEQAVISERRREPRISMDLDSVPFLGSRENGQPSFNYLLRDVSPSGVGIIVPAADRMVPLEVGETVNFHLPFQLNQKFYNQGVVRWERTVPQGQMCGAHLEKRVPLRYPIYVAFGTGDVRFIMEEFGIQSVNHLVEQILKDAFYLKKGVGIYFEHLAPFFARHSLQRVDRGPKRPQNIVPGIRAHIQDNVRIIENLQNRAAQGAVAHSFPSRADLETLRGAIALELNLNLLTERFSAPTVIPYLRSVRFLEHQLYSNLNTLVLVHLQTSGRRVVCSGFVSDPL
jgi:hypothetical protein